MARRPQFQPTDAIVKAEGLGWFAAAGELLKHIGPYRRSLILTILFGVTRVLAFIGVSAFSALAVKAVKSGEPFETFLILLAVAAPVAGIFHWFESWLAHDMAFRLLADMRIALFRKLDRLAPGLHGAAAPPATWWRWLPMTWSWSNTSSPIPSPRRSSRYWFPSIVIVTLLAFGWQMAAALAPFLAIVALAPFFLRKRVDELGSRAREALGELNAHAVDTIQGLAEIVAFQRTAERRNELIDRTVDLHRVRLPYFRDLTFQSAVLEVATGLGGMAVVVAGTSLVGAGSLDSGILPLLTLLAMAAFLPVSEIADVGRQLADTLGSTRRLYAVDNEPVTVTDGPGAKDVDASGGLPIILEGVDFRYETGYRRALQTVSFEAPAGKTVALVGPSGAGKTTIAHMLMRFWDPENGVIRLGTHDLKDYALDDLRQRMALVAQDTYLFNDTLRANILIADPMADETKLREVVLRASLGEFVDALPDGFDTRVGERGMRLSGGQRQRVAIARAFLKDAPILILDEATSHLDALNEKAVRESLEELMANRTTIVIAHRLSTVRDADLIIALNEGQVIETGTHSELLAKGGLYAQLVMHQHANRTRRSKAN